MYGHIIVKLLLKWVGVHKCGEAGILQENGLELISGETLEMSPIGSKHAATVEIIRDLLHTYLFPLTNTSLTHGIIFSNQAVVRNKVNSGLLNS